MKVLPIDIRQKSFPKKTFGGFDPSEVHSFLMTLSEEWLVLTTQNKDLKSRLKETQEELDRLHQMEAALLDALNKAELRKKEIINQSKQEAKVRIMEGEIAAEALMTTAKQRAEQMLNNVRVECEMQLKTMQHDFEVLTESYQEVETHTSKLIEEMKVFVSDANQKIAHLANLKQKSLITAKITSAKELLDTATELTAQVEQATRQKLEVATQDSNTSEIYNPLAHKKEAILTEREEVVKPAPTKHHRTTLQMLQEKAKSKGESGMRKVV
ncbi:MAG: DivIVA domain-containing protein [Flammeovirgaceae bacterium]